MTDFLLPNNLYGIPRRIRLRKKVSGSCFFHGPLTRSAEIDPAGSLGIRGSRLIWVSLRLDALLGPLAQVRVRPDAAVAPLDAVAEPPDAVVAQQPDAVAGLPL